MIGRQPIIGGLLYMELKFGSLKMPQQFPLQVLSPSEIHAMIGLRFKIQKKVYSAESKLDRVVQIFFSPNVHKNVY